MQPATLSASALGRYEACPAGYRADYIERTPDEQGSAAGLGTACHEAMEEYVKAGYHLKPDLAVLLKFYDVAYWKEFQDAERFEEGKDLLENWWNRTDLRDGRKVLTTEIKTTFLLKFTASDGTKVEIPVTYIFDRCDEHADGSIEVVDYKTTVIPLPPEGLKKKIQARMYGLAAAIQYPNRPAYWVTFDLLRYDPVGVKFTREDNIETYRYLQAVAQRIWDDPGTTENLNPECRWCVRKGVCETLMKHAAGGGHLRLDDVFTVIDERAKLEYAKGAIEALIRDADAFILAEAERLETLELATESTDMVISARATRTIDPERAAKVLGPDLMARYGSLTMKAIDEILKNGGLDSETKSALRQLIGRKLSAASVKTKPRAVIGNDD